MRTHIRIQYLSGNMAIAPIQEVRLREDNENNGSRYYIQTSIYGGPSCEVDEAEFEKISKELLQDSR